VSTAQPVRFPLYLRLPRWCEQALFQINGEAIEPRVKAPGYLDIHRIWKDGDSVALQLPMHISLRDWAKNRHAISVAYGPLSFSLKIGERWVRYGGSDAW